MSTTDKASNLPAAPTAILPSASERFTAEVMKQYSANAGDLSITSFQKKLIQNYFIKLDQNLKTAEKKRMLVKEDKRELLAYTWDNVNMQNLSVDVIAFSLIGLDPVQPNHINLIPYKNTANNKYDITFIIGYKGIELKAMKYGFDVPDDVIIDLVYVKDKFKSLKRDAHNRIESYIFEVEDDFDRGELRGGFYYHVYYDQPEKNKLRVFNMHDIEKRRPDHASTNFWGGEKDVWKDNKKVGTEKVEGWFEEMCYKTVARAAYNAITIDSEKIDEHFIKMIELDNERNTDLVGEDVKQQIATNANRNEMSFDDAEVVDDKKNLAQSVPEQSHAAKQENSAVKPDDKKITPQLSF